MNITISIADDHPMVIVGLRNMLQDFPHLEILGTYRNGAELLAGLEEQLPDILILDIQMPDQNGEELAHIIRKKYPGVKMMTLTNFDSPAYLSAMLRQGVLGYLLKTTEKETLAAAIEAVYSGKEYIEPSLKEKLDLLTSRVDRIADAKIRLTDKEKEVLSLIVEGYTDKEISAKLFLGLYTAKNYRTKLLVKMDVKNTAALIRKALQLGLVS